MVADIGTSSDVFGEKVPTERSTSETDQTTATSASATTIGSSCTSSEESSSSESLAADIPWPPSVIEAPDWPAFDPKKHNEDVFLMRRLLHWGPMIALTIIAVISAVTTNCYIMMYSLVDPYNFVCFTIFLVWNYLTLDNLLKASSYGPGYVPRDWKPANPEYEKMLQHCSVCEGFKVPRSHHCSKCKRCSMKMDHHCPWINNCVGHRNHAFFTKFLFFAIVGCIHGLVIMVKFFYHAIHLGWYLRFGDGTEPLVELTYGTAVSLIMGSAFAAAIALGLGVLLAKQMHYIWKNMSGIEEYIDAKAKERLRSSGRSKKEWIFPYNMGWKRNFQEIYTWSGFPRGNGVWWPVVESCDQFTLTIEQLKQKQVKRDNARVIRIREDFSGSKFASWKYGYKVFFCQPLIDGSAINVSKGEEWLVTGRTKHWAYGSKVGAEKTKGWFPIRICELMHDNDEKKSKKHD